VGKMKNVWARREGFTGGADITELIYTVIFLFFEDDTILNRQVYLGLCESIRSNDFAFGNHKGDRHICAALPTSPFYDKQNTPLKLSIAFWTC
jgi:hypothetical protein